MSHRVRIEQFDAEIVVEDGDTILSAALDEGLEYPFLCQQGQCGSCKSVLLSGEVDLGSFYNPMVLDEEERRRGFILACQAVPLSDCTVSIGEIGGVLVHPVRELACVVRAAEQASATIRVLELDVQGGAPLIYSAGQFATLTPAGRPAATCALASRPDEDILRFHIDVAANGDLAALAVGDAVAVRGPFGASYLREEHLGPILLAATGAGLGPVGAMVETALRIGMTQRLHVYVAARDAGALYHQEALQALAARHRNLIVTVALETADGTPWHRTGPLAEVIAADLADLSAFQAYLAAPAADCAGLRAMMSARGLPADGCFVLAPDAPA